MKWNIVLYQTEGNHLKLNREEQPKESGDYLCTCIVCRTGYPYNRYLQVMHYDADRNYWHDRWHENSISHTILAWTECETCDFSEFEVVGGYLLKPKEE